jgi:hypothetical protein
LFVSVTCIEAGKCIRELKEAAVNIIQLPVKINLFKFKCDRIAVHNVLLKWFNSTHN